MSNIIYNKNGIPFDVDAMLTDLNGKADIDFTNIDVLGTSRAASWALPSGTYEKLTLGASEATYTAPANGWVQFTQTFSGSTSFGISSINTDSDGLCMQGTGDIANVYIPVYKNQQFKAWYNGTPVANEHNRFVFIYAQGSESEAE